MGDDTNSWCSLGFAEPSAAYTSATQQARHLTEGWMAGHGVRPACPADRLPPLPNNTRVGDFRCAACGEEYELKSGQGAVAGVLPAGAWGAMKQRLAAANNPSLFVMGYDRAAHRVSELIVVPRHFFTEAIIRPRPPLGPDARRAGWQGCTIRLKDVPAAGRIPLIRHGAPRPQAEVRAAWAATPSSPALRAAASTCATKARRRAAGCWPSWGRWRRWGGRRSRWTRCTPTRPGWRRCIPATATSARKSASSCRC